MKLNCDSSTPLVSIDCPALRSGHIRVKIPGLLTGRGWKLKTVTLREDAVATPDAKILLARITKVERVDLTPHCLLLEESKNRRWYLSFQTDRELYDWQDDVYSRCPKISGTTGSPFGFVHSMHVGFEPVTGNFTGLPSNWYDSLGLNDQKKSPIPLHGATVVSSSSRRTSLSSVVPPTLSQPGRTYKRISAQPASAFFESSVEHKKDGLFAWRWVSRWTVLGPDTLTISKSKASGPDHILLMNEVVQLERCTDRPYAMRVRLKSGAVHRLSFQSDREVHTWQDALYSRSPLGGTVVGNPQNFAHRVHVGIDPQTGEFTGLPEQWRAVMLNLNVS